MKTDFDFFIVGSKEPSIIIFWLVMSDEVLCMGDIYSQLIEKTGREDFCVYPIVVKNWNADLSPWEYNTGKRIFEGKATNFFDSLLKEYKMQREKYPKARFVLGGYSMAGLFALWSGYKTDVFDTIVSGSGSLWFPGFVEKYKDYKIKAESVYISLGNKEKKCRDRMMAEIENRTVCLFESLECNNKKFVMEKGNHFTECKERMIRGFVWALNGD